MALAWPRATKNKARTKAFRVREDKRTDMVGVGDGVGFGLNFRNAFWVWKCAVMWVDLTHPIFRKLRVFCIYAECRTVFALEFARLLRRNLLSHFANFGPHMPYLINERCLRCEKNRDLKSGEKRGRGQSCSLLPLARFSLPTCLPDGG